MRLTTNIITLILLYSTATAQTPEMVEGWPYITKTEIWAVYAIPRFSFDTSLDYSAVFFNNITREIDKFHLDGTFYEGWPLTEDSVIFARTPIVVDIDHDGRDELVTYGARRSSGPPYYLYSMLYLVDDDGSVMPGFPIIYSRPKPLNVADLDGDGEYEILTFSVDEGLIYCIDRFGNPRPGWPVDLPEDILWSGASCAIGDLDLDGTNEYIFTGMHNIYAYRYDGIMQSGFPVYIYDDSYYHDYTGWGPSVADIDLDGYLEVMISAGRPNDDWTYSGYVAVYEHTGAMRENWPMMFPVGLVRPSPIPADINGDAILEFGFSVTMLDQTYFVDADARILPGWPAPLSRFNAEIIIVDLDGDGDCEIFSDYNSIHADSMGADSNYYYGYGLQYGYDHFGEELPGYPIEVGGSYFRRPPTFGYDENSNRVYMGLFTELNLLPVYDLDTAYVEIYRFPDSTGRPDQWPMVGHDNLMTRNYNFVDYATGIHDGQEIVPKSCILKQNYPNPFNNSTVIEFALPGDELVNLTVYDILGRVVFRPVDSELRAGSHKIVLDFHEVSSGMYFYVLSADNVSINRKMILLK